MKKRVIEVPENIHGITMYNGDTGERVTSGYRVIQNLIPRNRVFGLIMDVLSFVSDDRFVRMGWATWSAPVVVFDDPLSNQGTTIHISYPIEPQRKESDG